MDTIVVEPLTGSTGARVVGIDPREVDDEQVVAIRSALAEHGVLVLSAPGLTRDEQVTFTARFGPAHGHPVQEFLRGGPADPVSTVENDAVKLPQNDQHFHVDYSFHTHVPALAVLRPEVLPPRGGDTIWSSAAAAFAGLSPRVQDFVRDLHAIHDAGEQFWFEMDRTLGADATAKLRRAFPGATHPVVAVHPVSGAPLLFVNAGYTRRIVGLHERESRALLDLLFAQMQDPAYHYRHHWDHGDLVMWDELTTTHMGPNDFAPAERRLTRVTAGRVAP
jgi:taurine dioxygenase